MPRIKRTKRRKSVTKRAKITAVVCAGSAVALTFAGLSFGQREELQANAAAAEQFNSAVTAPTAEPTESQAPADVPAILEGENVVISVLGDSTGNSTGEWVDLWAQDIAESATVTMYLWDQTAEQYRPDPITYGSGAKQVTIWNGSMPGATADYPTDKMSTILPESPSTVILSYGHNGAPETVAPAFQETAEALAGAAPDADVLVVMQNAAGEPRRARTDQNQMLLRNWATNAGLPIIDVRAAFDTQPNLEGLLLDDGTGVHPNDAGSRVWAEALQAAL